MNGYKSNSENRIPHELPLKEMIDYNKVCQI